MYAALTEQLYLIHGPAEAKSVLPWRMRTVALSNFSGDWRFTHPYPLVIRSHPGREMLGCASMISPGGRTLGVS